jgi:inorganic pyrophosphatase
MPYQEEKRTVEITHVYGKDEAREVIQLSMQDYSNQFNARKRELLSMIQEGLKI